MIRITQVKASVIICVLSYCQGLFLIAIQFDAVFRLRDFKIITNRKAGFDDARYFQAAFHNYLFVRRIYCAGYCAPFRPIHFLNPRDQNTRARRAFFFDFGKAATSP